MQDPHSPTPRPWWRYGHVWLLIAGPLAVVLAGIVTVYLALSRPDPLVTEQDRRQDTGSKEHAQSAPLAPAVQARNHAATGAPPPARP